MNILYITSEAAPFCKTGGLADVLGSLPPAVAAEGDHTAVLLPLYGQIAQRWREKMNFRCYIYVDLGWRHEYCGLFSLEYRGVTWYFADNERYFRRRGLYGDMDDGERFAFFSKAAVALLPHLAEYPNVVHCNDWQTALVPVYLRDAGNDLPVVFTIHNVEYQGKYGPETVEDLFGLNRGWYDGGILRMDGCVNLMKGAMLTANAVTTVSPTYAAQLHDPAYACGLEQVVHLIDYKLSGVLNGLDIESYNPAHDGSPDLRPRPYGGQGRVQGGAAAAAGPCPGAGHPADGHRQPPGGPQGHGPGVPGSGGHYGHRLPAGGAGPGGVPV